MLNAPGSNGWYCKAMLLLEPKSVKQAMTAVCWLELSMVLSLTNRLLPP